MDAETALKGMRHQGDRLESLSTVQATELPTKVVDLTELQLENCSKKTLG
jgi:hypothetical protein